MITIISHDCINILKKFNLKFFIYWKKKGTKPGLTLFSTSEKKKYEKIYFFRCHLLRISKKKKFQIPLSFGEKNFFCYLHILLVHYVSGLVPEPQKFQIFLFENHLIIGRHVKLKFHDIQKKFVPPLTLGIKPLRVTLIT